MQHALRAVSSPQRKEVMDVVLERSAAPDGDEARVSDLGEDHSATVARLGAVLLRWILSAWLARRARRSGLGRGTRRLRRASRRRSSRPLGWWRLGRWLGLLGLRDRFGRHYDRVRHQAWPGPIGDHFRGCNESLADDRGGQEHGRSYRRIIGVNEREGAGGRVGRPSIGCGGPPAKQWQSSEAARHGQRLRRGLGPRHWRLRWIRLVRSSRRTAPSPIDEWK